MIFNLNSEGGDWVKKISQNPSVNLNCLLRLFSFVVDEPSPIDWPNPSNEWWNVDQPPSEPNEAELDDTNDEGALFHLRRLIDAWDKESTPAWREYVEDEEDQMHWCFCSWNLILPLFTAHLVNYY